MSKNLVFVGGFSWAISLFLIIIGIFYLQTIDSNNVQGDHYEIFIGFIGANILSAVIAIKQFTSGSYSYSTGSDDESLISTVAGFSLGGFICLIVWLLLSDTPI
ncbi:MAG: hypothetical protein ACFFD1_11320, partial [Candidatus Thorarchaeota archaeon]